MDKNTNAVESTPVAAPEKVEVPATETQEEARIQAIEAEKAKIREERDNYKNAFLKEKAKNKGEEIELDETEDERFRRIAREELAATKVGQLDQEKEAIYAKVIKENKELRLASANKTNVPPIAMGSHSEHNPVKDRLISDQQMEYFTKTLKWGTKEIEAYKKNVTR